MVEKNKDPMAPWNSPMFKNDPMAPHNDPIKKDDPFKPWNKPIWSKRELTLEEKKYYRIRD
jgi:hypothetical protein